MARFAGTVKVLTPIAVDSVAGWITAIPFGAWHQQHPTQPNQLRPAMMTDPDWHGFKAETDGLAQELMAHFPGCVADQRMLSVVMPGDSIPPHVDEQPESWKARVHVPLQGDEDAKFIVSGETHYLRPGLAYLVNTLTVHSVTNNGATPRIHFMFDVRAA